MIIWMTGLSGAGKTTIAKKLHKGLSNSVILDGDELRNIYRNTDFSKEGRINHIVNTGKLAALLESYGVTVIVSLISPYKEARDRCRELAKEFKEIYVHCPLQICEQRDVKGLYRKARAGEIKGFTGIDDPYEVPENPEMILRTDIYTEQDCVNLIEIEINEDK